LDSSPRSAARGEQRQLPSQLPGRGTVSAAAARVRFTRSGDLGIVTLDNPPLNQIGQQLLEDFEAALSEIEAEAGLRALLLRGEGKVFSAGADVHLFSGLGADDIRPLVGSFLDLGRRMEQLSFPTIAAVHGTCMAGGLELALFCDLIWAAEGTMLGLPETRLGIVPLAGGVERIAARAGLGRARAIALGGDLHSAEDFKAWGMIDHVVPADTFHAGAEAFAQSLASGPTRAFGVVKQLARAYTRAGIAGADALLLTEAVDLFSSDDARGGIRTFIDEGPGKAKFAGR
jgi:enoyl-CoA hydratase/carnithine racemase